MNKTVLVPLLFLMLGNEAAACNLNRSEPVIANLAATRDNSPPRRVLISNNSHMLVPAIEGTLQLHNAQDFTLVAQLNQWPVAGSNPAPIVSDPFIVDTNYDGVADLLYAININGMLWVVPLRAQGFGQPKLVADLRETGLRFEQPIHVVQTLTADSQGIVKPQAMVLISGSDEQGDTFFAIKHSSESNATIVQNQLIDRSTVTEDEVRFGVAEQLWTDIQQSSGWWIRFTQRLTVVPQVYGGVVYFTTVTMSGISASCELSADAAVTLHAIHLHHAGLVYAQRNWITSVPAVGALGIQRGSDNELTLVLETAQLQHSILTGLQKITEECADCVAPLRVTQFPLRMRLATFQSERGAH